MKTLKIVLLLAIILITEISFSQTQTPNTLPATGDVGVGTTAPSAKLEVVGDTKLGGRVDIDSSVVVRDSVTIKKKLIVDQDVLIKGTSTFVGDGKFKADLKVLGVAKMMDNLVIDGVTKMNGDFKMLNYANPTLTTNRLLTIGPNGKVQPIASISIPDPLLPDPNCGSVLAWNYYVNAKNPLDPQLYAILCSSYRGVGIGTNTPNATLDVAGTFRYADGNQGFNKVLISDADGFATWQDASIINDGDWTINGNDIYRQTGNVGIGTSTPLAKLDVNGNIKVTTNGNSAEKPIAIVNTSGTDIFRVMGNGHVYATKVLVRSTPFPDFVFEKDYELMSLYKLEEYIKINKSLPNMPTAVKVEKDGADLGEINRILVQKTEELTLYIIGLKKELDNLKQEVESLKKQ